MLLVKTVPGAGLSVPLDAWPVLGTEDALPADGPALVPLATWLAQRDALRGRVDIGVWLDGGDDLAALVPDLPRLAVVAVRFAAFTDGRGYSLARLLRDRHAFRGEVRAIGDVLVDQAGFLARAGFDAFHVGAGTDLARFAAALNRHAVVYQAAADARAPALALRTAAAVGRAAE